MKNINYVLMLGLAVLFVGLSHHSSFAAIHTEIVLCLDVSGSIDDTELGIEIDGLKACLNNEENIPRDGTIAVAIVVYGRTAADALGTLTPITAASLPSTIEPVLDGLLVDRLVSTTATNTGQGLINSRNILASGITNNQYILLVGDGDSTTGPNINTECANIAAANIKICAIAVGATPPGIDELRECAETTGGYFVVATTFEDFLPNCESCIEHILPLKCSIDIISPLDNAILCGDEIEVTSMIVVTGGVPPYTKTCEVNGIAANMADTDSLFTVTVPCTNGVTELIARCTITDSLDSVIVCADTVSVVCAGPPVCELFISTPADGDVVCETPIEMSGITNVIDGIKPFSFTCEVSLNGSDIPIDVDEDVVSATFTAILPLLPGENTIIAKCTVEDSCNKISVCMDTCVVILDTFPPTCEFTADGSTITGTVTDNESGILDIFPSILKNGELVLDPFTPGDHTVNFRIEAIDPNQGISFTLLMTDLCMNTGKCDPVLLNLAIDPGQSSSFRSFTFSSIDRYLQVVNHGLSEIRLILNGSRFQLYSDPFMALNENNGYTMPVEGDVSFDLAPFLREGDNNVMEIFFNGPGGSYAELLLVDVIPQFDFVLDIQNPTQFQLAQNFPNPFNPSTTIRYDIPGDMAEGVQVKIDIYNLLGEFIQTLVDERKLPGSYQLQWDGTNQSGLRTSTGIYYYRMTAGSYNVIKKMTLVK